MIVSVPVVLAFLIGAWLTWRFSKPSSVFYVLDHPNVRSLHSEPTPRTGGIAILVAVYPCLAGIAVFSSANLVPLAWIAGIGLLLAAVSFADDRIGLSPVYRIVAHLVCAGLMLYAGFSLVELELPGMTWAFSNPTSAIVSIMFIVWMVNLYNFMDGMDGFAAGMAVIGFGVFALFGGLAGDRLFMTASLIVAASAGGFLLFNFPPARIFMGDVGSSVLGLFAAGFSLWGAREGLFPFWAALLTFSPFIVDATVTLIRRALRRERLWEAHRSHYYQRLVRLGWGHRKTVLFEYALMLGSGLCAIVAVRLASSFQWAVLSGWAVIYIVVFSRVSRLETRPPRSIRSGG